MQIAIDSREQTPLDFSSFEGCTVGRATLPTGDYSLFGLQDVVAIERKSLSDLIGSLTHGRDRFERELARMRSYTLRGVVVEASYGQIARGEYRSQAKPHTVLQSVLGLSVRYGVPFWFVETHKAAAYTVHGLFRHFLKQREKELRALLKNLPTEEKAA